jgi:hypothetical protein
MTTALASLLTQRPVKHTVGMTGEVTLQGRVLPIGGLKQKVLAAHAAGLTEVIIPERNRATSTTSRRRARRDDVPSRARASTRCWSSHSSRGRPCAAGGVTPVPRRSAARRTSSSGADPVDPLRVRRRRDRFNEFREALAACRRRR